MFSKAPTETLSVVIPMYNEEGNVAALINEITTALARHPDYEIIVVDDGSSDATHQRLQELAAKEKRLRIVQHQRNFGQSVGILSGVNAATKSWIATLDGDGQNDPADILKLAEAVSVYPYQLKPILVTGHRTQRKDSGWKKFGSRFANKIRRWFLKDDCPDTGCGLKLFPRNVFLALPHFNHVHRYLPALFQRQGAIVINVPVNHRPRLRGQSKYGNFGRLKVGIVDLLGVAWLMRRPCQGEIVQENKID